MTWCGFWIDRKRVFCTVRLNSICRSDPRLSVDRWRARCSLTSHQLECATRPTPRNSKQHTRHRYRLQLGACLLNNATRLWFPSLTLPMWTRACVGDCGAVRKRVHIPLFLEVNKAKSRATHKIFTTKSSTSVHLPNYLREYDPKHGPTSFPSFDVKSDKPVERPHHLPDSVEQLSYSWDMGNILFKDVVFIGDCCDVACRSQTSLLFSGNIRRYETGDNNVFLSFFYFKPVECNSI